MRVVRGIEEGRKALTRDAFFQNQGRLPEVLAGIKRVFGQELTLEEAVSRIVKDVSQGGDASVRDYTSRIDGVDLESLALDRDQMLELAASVPRETTDALRRAASRVREFHTASLPRPWVDMDKGFGEMITPIERAGVYIPGGQAPYPSTLLMTAIPAKVAGVKEVVITTPPHREHGPNPTIMAAALIAGVDRIFQVGGAQAIAAMAYGTESIPKVDLICGPGNVFVTTAKRMVFGQTGIDGMYGPTETLIVADETANPSLCAADLLGQAEHDLLATPVLVTTSEALIQPIQEEVRRQLDTLSRKETAMASMESRGVFVVVDTMEEALELANDYAPEHLCLMVKEPWSWVGKVHNAGGIFLGEYSPEVMGDYVAGPSHVMPTGGTARFSSALGVAQFLRRTPVVALDQAMTLRFAKTAAILARTEGFDAHARAVEMRVELHDHGSHHGST